MCPIHPRISVLICTWNRPDGVKAALDGLAKQTLPFEEFEVVVIDNNPTDNIREVVGSLANNVPYNLTYLTENRPGKCWALNTGIAAARGEIIACLDDDCVPEPDWLAEMVKAFEFSAPPNMHLVRCKDDTYSTTSSPIRTPETSVGSHLENLENKEPGKVKVGIIGGPCLSVFPDNIQSDPYRLFLAKRFFGDFAPYDRVTEIFDKNLPLGMNLAFRKEVALAVGGFDVTLGPRPGAHLGREETRFIRAAQQAGYRVFYCPTMIVRHYIEEKRITWENIRRHAYFSGRGVCRERYARAARGSPISKILPTGIFLTELAYSSLRTILFALFPRKAAVARFRAIAALGKLVELWSDSTS